MKQLSLSESHAIVLVGIPGSGKTTFATKFSETFKVPQIHIETIQGLTSSKKAAIQVTTLQLGEIAKTGKSVVLDLDIYSKAERTALTRQLDTLGYKTVFVWVQTDTKTAQTRNKSKHTETQYDTIVKKFDPLDPAEKAVVISGKHTYATQAKAVLMRLVGKRDTQGTSVPKRSFISIRRDG